MNSTPSEPAKDSPPVEHRESSLARRRRTPMWGCVTTIFWIGVGLVALLILFFGGLYYYSGTDRFARMIKQKVEANLASRLDRKVTIKRVILKSRLPAKVILQGITIENAPGAVNPYFATVREVEITGGVESFWRRQIEVGLVEIRDPRINFEVFPEGSALVHNFPKWKSTPPRRYQIYRMDISRLLVSGGGFDFLDRKHDIQAVISGMSADVRPTMSKQIYEGVATSPKVVVRLQDYLPFELDLRGGFRYDPGMLQLKSIALRGRNIEAFISGKLDPLTEAQYDLDVSMRTRLERIAEIFRIEKQLAGLLVLSGELKGKQGDFVLDAGFTSPQLVADVYELGDVRGRMVTTDEGTKARVESAKYGGGTMSADYQLTKYAEPYPMSIELNYEGISIEKLFSDWTVRDTGLRGSATGSLTYEWEKDRILEGRGSGRARLDKGAVAFGNAKYPTPIGGNTKFALNNGVITFAPSSLDTDKSHIDFAGTLTIEELIADLNLAIKSEDFSELDRIAYNFAHSLDRKDFELLGLGGSGTIKGTVKGPLDKAQVQASVSGSRIAYNNTVIGDGDLELAYNGVKGVLTFDRATFREGDRTISLAGTLTFPDSGPGPVFDLKVDADRWDVEKALALVDLDLGVKGIGTGSLKVTGTPERGRVQLDRLRIAQGAEADLNLNGSIDWLPGEGNVAFDLDIGARAVPIKTIVDFLELGDIPVTGDVTGTLHLEGSKKELEGAGAVTIRNGVIFGEPIELASADLLFTKGTMRASNVIVRAAAGTIEGEATVDMNAETFSYMVKATELDLSKLTAASSFSNVITGRVNLTSSGAGSFERPEIVVEGAFVDGSILGTPFPEDVQPPSFYFATRGGQLIVKADVLNVLNVEGTGTIAENGEVDGTVQIRAPDVAKLLAYVAPRSEFPAAGSLVVNLDLGGKISPLEALIVEGTVPTLDLVLDQHRVTTDAPIRFALRNGRVEIESFSTRVDDSTFQMSGFASLSGDGPIDLNVKGLVEAAVLQLFVSDVRAEGHVNLAISVTGSMKVPRITGTAEVVDAEFRFAGFPQVIDDVRATLVLRGDRIEIDALTASLGGGQISAGGFVTLDGLKPQRFRLNLLGTDVSIRYFTGVTVDGDMELLLSGDTERAVLQGNVQVDRALYYRDFDFTASLLNLVLERRGLLPAVAASWQDRVSLRVTINAPETLAVKNNIADVTASTEGLELTGTLANPVILGIVTIDEGGKIRFQNVDYRVVRGTINFQNPFRIDPYFDITAEGRAKEYDLTINLTGTLDRINPIITSDPPTTDLTLLSLIGIGQQGGLGARANQDLATSLGAGATSLLVESLGGFLGSRVLPFADSFRFDLVEGNLADPQVTFEKQISDDVRAVVIYNLKSKDNIEIIEWQVTPDWVVQLTRDSQEQESAYLISAVDARFRRRYNAHWGGRRKEAQPVGVARVTSVFGNEPADEPRPERGPLGGAAYGGVTVRNITFETDSEFNITGLENLVKTKPGSQLSLRDVQDSIESLYGTGQFRDVHADATREGNQVDLLYRLFLHRRIDDITIQGLGDLKVNLSRELQVKEGQVLSLDAVERSATAIQALLGRRGYREATVDTETRFDRPTNRTDVFFYVTLGPRARISGFDFEGNLAPFTAEDLLRAAKTPIGEHFTTERARRYADRMRSFAVRREHRRASVRYAGDTYDAERDSIRLRYRVDIGPLVRVAVEGVPRDAVRRWLPFRRKNEEYSEDVIARSIDRITEEYQRRGHFFVAVDTEERETPEELTVVFKIDPGAKYEVDQVIFEGNEQLSDKQLQKAVGSGRVGAVRRLLASLVRRGVGVTQAMLSDDRDALESLYRIEGFTQPDIGQPQGRAKAGGKLDIVFPITEGPRTIVREVIVEGNEQVEDADLPRLVLQADDPLNPQELATDLLALQTFYGERGNIEVQVSPRVEYSEDRTSATVTYRVAEGAQVSVDDVLVEGNTYTKTSVIARKSALRKGEPFTYRALLAAQRELYRLGIFKRVDIDPEKTSTDVAQRDVKIQVEEGQALTVAGSIGYSNEQGSRTSVTASHRNLFGTARYLGIEATVGQRENRFFVTYREPFIFNYDIPTQLTVFESSETRNADFEIDIRRRGLFIEASRVSRETVRWSLRYDYRIVEIDCEEVDRCTDTIPIPDLLRQDQRTKIASITPTFFWDRRDDPLNPSRGLFASSSFEYAFPAFDADAHFLKSFTQSSWYRPLTPRTVLALSGRLGLIEPLGDSPRAVPFSERFTAGGETSHRGFRLDQLGILGEFDENGSLVPPNATLINDPRFGIVALGGNATVILNAEYRFPLFGSLQGATFVDIGNVWSEIDMIDFGELRYGVGLGLRYLTPVGPIRLDLGINPDPDDHEDQFIPFLTIGHPF